MHVETSNVSSHFILIQLCQIGVLSTLQKVKLRLKEQKQLVQRLRDWQSWHSDSAHHLFLLMTSNCLLVLTSEGFREGLDIFVMRRMRLGGRVER